jgi:hypothetical protein
LGTRTKVNQYGHAHRAERKRWAPVVGAGQAWCTEIVCRETSRWIAPGSAWDLAHDRAHGGYLGPSHAGCNRAEGAREKHKRKHGRWNL